MAAAFVAVRGTGGGTGFATSFTITGVTCAAGNDVVVLVDSSQAITSISDGTNTYTIDKAFPGTNKKGCIAHYHYSGGFSGTVTVNLAGASVDYNGEAWECSGFNGANSSTDVRDSASTTSGFGSTVDAGTTASSAQIGDLIVAGFVTNTGGVQTLTPGSGYTAVATVRASTNSELLGEYQVAASVAVAHPTGSISSASPSDGACVIYKGAAASGNQAVTPAAITSSSSMSGAVTALKRATPAAITAASTLTGSLVKLGAVRPAAATATSTLTGRVVALHVVSVAAFTASSPLAGNVSGGTSVSAESAALVDGWVAFYYYG